MGKVHTFQKRNSKELKQEMRFSEIGYHLTFLQNFISIEPINIIFNVMLENK